MYSDALCSGLHRLCNNCPAPCICAPTCATPCLFVYLFTFVIGTHVAFFVCLFPLPVVSNIDRQWANTKSDCTHCIRRGLGRRLRSSLLLNLSPKALFGMKKLVSSCHFLIQKLAVSFLFLQLVSITPGKETKRN